MSMNPNGSDPTKPKPPAFTTTEEIRAMHGIAKEKAPKRNGLFRNPIVYSRMGGK